MGAGSTDSREEPMATQHTPADDIVYDLVAIQDHALQGAEATDKYLKDAEGHDDVRAFFEEVAQQDADRALRAHKLLGSLTSSAGLSPQSFPRSAGRRSVLPFGRIARVRQLIQSG